jgi:hypothetical protein
MKKILICLMVILTSICFGAFKYETSGLSDPGLRPANMLGSFDTAEFQINSAAARNAGGGEVGIPITGHPFIAGDVISILGTTNYNRGFKVESVSANEVVITSSYTAETFTETAKATYSVKTIFQTDVLDSLFTAVWTSTSSDVTAFLGSRHFYGCKWAIPAIDGVDSGAGELAALQLSVTAFDATDSVLTVRYYSDRPYSAFGSTTYPQEWTAILSSSNTISGSVYRVSIPLAAGWHEVNIPLSQFLQSSSPDITAIDMVGFLYKSHATEDQTAFNIYFDSIKVTSTGRTKGAFMFTFDDAYLPHRTIAAPYLSANGFRSINYIEGNTIGIGAGNLERMTIAQVREIANLGMLPCGHWSGAYFGTTQGEKDVFASEERVRQWCEGIKTWMYDNGFYEGADYLALPGGTGYIQSESHIKIMREYFNHIRGTTPWRRMGPYTSLATSTANTSPQGIVGKLTFPTVSTEPWWGAATQIPSNASFDTNMKAYVDAVVANGDLGVLFIHNIEAGGTLGGTAGAGYDLNQTQFEALVDYVKTKVDAGTLDVITYQDLISTQGISSGKTGGYRGRYRRRW